MTSKRDISTLNETAVLSQVVRPIVFARMAFSSGVQRLHTEIGPRTAVHPIHGSEVYTGIGDFGGMASDIDESIAPDPKSVKIAITGIDTTFIDIALDDDYFRRDIEMMLGFDDENGVLEDDPVIVYSGFMDKADITLGKGTGSITLTCESRLTNLRGASDARFTDEDLQIAVAGDLGGEYIYRMADLVLKWGGNQQGQSTVNSAWAAP